MAQDAAPSPSGATSAPRTEKSHPRMQWHFCTSSCWAASPSLHTVLPALLGNPGPLSAPLLSSDKSSFRTVLLLLSLREFFIQVYEFNMRKSYTYYGKPLKCSHPLQTYLNSTWKSMPFLADWPSNIYTGSENRTDLILHDLRLFSLVLSVASAFLFNLMRSLNSFPAVSCALCSPSLFIKYFFVPRPPALMGKGEHAKRGNI